MHATLRELLDPIVIWCYLMTKSKVSDNIETLESL